MSQGPPRPPDGVEAGPPLRIVAVAPNPVVSGAERVLLRYLVDARDRGDAVSCLVPPGDLACELRAAGVVTAELPDLAVPAGPRAIGAVRLLTRWAAAARTIRAAARTADVLLLNGFLALPAVRLARVRVPVAWLVHDVVHRRSWTLLLTACAAAVDRALAVSEAVAEPLRRTGVAVSVVRNGTTWPVAPAPARDLEGPAVVGVNAMLTSWKGQDVLLEAVAHLRRAGGDTADVEVELMGGRFARDGPFVERLEARAAQPDLAGRVRLLGHVADPLARMRTWAVAVSASVEPEAAPLNVLEAMSLGVPLVGTDHGGTPEVLGAAGLLVRPGDAPAMARAIGQLLTDADLHARCARAGPAAVAAGLRLEDATATFRRALGEVAGSGRAPGRGRAA